LTYPVTDLLRVLRCPQCLGRLTLNRESPEAEVWLLCFNCDEKFPFTKGIARMLSAEMRGALGSAPSNEDDRKKAATARSFGYEWSRFPEMHAEWERNFLEYMAPRAGEFFEGKRVLDAGCGTGRHAHYAAKYGAEVWAVDLGEAVEVAQRNTAAVGVNVVQADVYNLPFEHESFDFIYSNGVLHHLPHPEEAFHNLLRFLKPGGEIQVYLYWKPEGQPLKRLLLSVVAACRQITTGLPIRAVHALSVPAACVAFVVFVWPYRAMRRLPGLRRLAERMPMKQYASYPFKVCVNDQLDRLSAPIEHRYTRAQVESWLLRAGLEQVEVRTNFGWCGTGRKPYFSREPVAANEAQMEPVCVE
jgi:SAM-dependent methyltransferase/uncharacterized protein YbaR (Trm112 family)